DGARRTLADVAASIDRAHVLRAIAIARATSAAIAEYRAELGELPDLDAQVWDEDEIVPAIAEELCRRGDVAGAGALAADLADDETRGRTLQCIAAAEAHAGRLAEARAVVARIEDPAAAAAARGDIAIAQASAGDSAGALET